MKKLPLLVLTLLALAPLRAQVAAPPQVPIPALPAGASRPEELFAPDNLHAWCAVPFDAKQRGPEERAAMLQRLGFKRFVYDWREKDIPTFDAEIEAMKKHGIEVTGWWSPTDPADPVLLKTLEVFKRQNVHPQLWVMGAGAPVKTPEEQTQRVEQEAERIRQIAALAKPYGCKVQLYNHNGWFGVPDNEVAVIERLRQLGVTDAGMVYNFSHGHNDIADFPAIWKRMQRYVVAVNVTGMVENGESKIMPPSQGRFESGMLRVILESGWRGPIGLIAEQGGDAEVTLGNYLRGLDWLKKEFVRPGSGGPKPDFAAAARGAKQVGRLVPGRFGRALDAGGGGALLVAGEDAWRTAPITVEAWAKLRSAKNFNVVTASDTKDSGAHWEIYSYAGAGDFSVYLPGQGGEVRSGAGICDGAWHHLAMVLEKERVRLFVDGKLVKAQPLPPRTGASVPGDLGIGRTVEDGIACDGLVDDVRISRGAREISAAPASPLTRDDTTLALWSLDELPKTAAATLPERDPLIPAAHPLHAHPVNRERIFDFYAKQARDWHANPSALLPEYPGLDSGLHGHWGNQTEETWRDGRWKQMDVGTRLAGVFRGAGITVPKGVCVRLGENGGRSACYDPVADEWRALWQGGFVNFSDTRHGLMDGLLMDGQLIEDELTARTQGARPPRKYRGFYQHGKRTVFAFESDGAEELMSAQFEGGKVRRESGGTLREFTKGGPAQWPQILETQGSPGKAVPGWPYVVDTLTLPFDNPWRALFFIGGHDFFSNGDIAVCTMTGDVWRVSGVDAALSKLRWKRKAAGLHQPLGLVIVEDKVCVLGRDQITRLHDLNADGEADFYECLSNEFSTPTGGHDFMCGLERDALGNFYTASGSHGLLRIFPGKKTEVLASGFRNPDGLGLAPDGTLTVPYSEGEWTPTSAVAQITPGGYYGYPGPRTGSKTLPPLLWLPRGEDNSAGGQTWVPDDRWGAMRGQMLHFSYGAGTHFLVLRQQVNGVWQGAAIPLPGDFNSGAHRARFSPRDGQLCVSGMTGWGTYTPDDGSLQRVRYTGGPVQIPTAIEARDNGVLLTLSEKPDASAADIARHFAQTWNYRYSQAYGSKEYSLRQPDKAGHDVLEIKSAHLLGDGRRLFLEIPQLQPASVLHLRCDLPGLVPRDIFFTLHQLGAPFTEFPGYTAIAKTAPDPHAHHAPAAGAAALPVKWEQGAPGRDLRIQTAAALQFVQKELRAKAGERLSLTLENPDVMQHNWVLIKPAAAERVGELANKMIASPDALSRNYVPDSPDIICHTRVVDPQKTTTIHFNAPAQPGRYPYVCTFPGHWMLMRGELVVE